MVFNQDKCSGSRRYHKACHKCRSCGKLLAPGKAHLHNKEPYCRSVWGKHLHFWAHWLRKQHVPFLITSESNEHNWAQTNVAEPAMHQLPVNKQFEQLLQDLLYSNHEALLTCAFSWHDHHQVCVHFEHLGHLEQFEHLERLLVSWTFLTFEHLEHFGFFEHHGHLKHLDHFETLWSLVSCCGHLF